MIKLKRKQSQTDYGCPYKVYINNKNVGEIRNGEEIGFNLDKGDHTLQVKGPNFVSKVINFTIDSDEFLSFTCFPTYTEGKVGKLVTKLLNGKIGISLEKSTDIYL